VTLEGAVCVGGVGEGYGFMCRGCGRGYVGTDATFSKTRQCVLRALKKVGTSQFFGAPILVGRFILVCCEVWLMDY